MATVWEHEREQYRKEEAEAWRDFAAAYEATWDQFEATGDGIEAEEDYRLAQEVAEAATRARRKFEATK